MLSLIATCWIMTNKASSHLHSNVQFTDLATGSIQNMYILLARVTLESNQRTALALVPDSNVEILSSNQSMFFCIFPYIDISTLYMLFRRILHPSSMHCDGSQGCLLISLSKNGLVKVNSQLAFRPWIVEIIYLWSDKGIVSVPVCATLSSVIPTLFSESCEYLTLSRMLCGKPYSENISSSQKMYESGRVFGNFHPISLYYGDLTHLFNTLDQDHTQIDGKYVYTMGSAWQRCQVDRNGLWLRASLRLLVHIFIHGLQGLQIQRGKCWELSLCHLLEIHS